jgi:hypothetical protein
MIHYPRNDVAYAALEESYQGYFRDMFGGDFGHCTPKGNRLLAKNIAQEILKNIL